MSDLDPQQLLREGKLTEARDVALQAVKAHPTDKDARGVLIQVLCFCGELERAAKQLEIAAQQDPSVMYAMAAMRRLVDAEATRNDCFSQGEVPEFFGPESEALTVHGEVLSAYAKGESAAACETLGNFLARRPPIPGKTGDITFADMRDMDDLTASVLEVFTLGGAYAWVALEHVERLQLQEVRTPLDQLWRTALLTVRGGLEGEVFLPCLYCGTNPDGDDQLRLGKGTDWSEDSAGIVRGRGQKMFACGESDVAIHELATLELG